MTATPESGATRAAGEEKRKLWPWLLLAALIAALLIWWIVAALTGDDDAELDTDAATPDTSTSEMTETETMDADPTDDASPSPALPTEAGLGVILIGDLDALAPDVDLSGSLDEPVEANSVQVQEVVADEAFFVGPEAGQTILVRLQAFGGEDDPESPFSVAAGDTVSFTGTLQQIDDQFLSELQLYQPSDELETGDFYIQAEDVTVTE